LPTTQLTRSLSARRLGYRSTNRYLVFQALPHTLALQAPVWRVLAKAHQQRNLAEYGGSFEVDERLVADLIEACETVAKACQARAKSP
jgi:hypothetical protein